MTIYLDRIKAAIAPLLANEFSVVSVIEDAAAFGNTCVVLASTTLAIRMIYDRGQFSADVSLAGPSKDWYELRDLSAVVCSRLLAVEEPSGSVEAIVSNLKEITDALRSPKRLHDEGISPRT